jgi:hypothetical protein
MTTIGHDCEFFAEDRSGYISPVTSSEMQGTKQEPIPFGMFGTMLQRDNVSLEVTIPVANSVEEFLQFTRQSVDDAASWVAENKPQCYLSTNPVGDLRLIHTMLDEAQEFGCERDHDAWTGRRNPRVVFPEDMPERFLGGHLHFGTDHDPFAVCRSLEFVGGAMLAIRESPSMRQDFYGRSGACRPKPYGVEWRAPGSRWSTLEDPDKVWIKLLYWVVNNEPDLADRILRAEEVKILQDTINTRDYDKGQLFFLTYVVPVIMEAKAITIHELYTLLGG